MEMGCATFSPNSSVSSAFKYRNAQKMRRMVKVYNMIWRVEKRPIVAVREVATAPDSKLEKKEAKPKTRLFTAV